MWVYRRMLKISWVDHIINMEVMRRVNKERELVTNIKRRQAAYFAHIMRGLKYQLLQLIIKGKNKRGIGRKQLSCLRNIRQWTGVKPAGDLVHIANNREEYSNLVANIL